MNKAVTFGVSSFSVLIAVLLIVIIVRRRYARPLAKVQDALTVAISQVRIYVGAGQSGERDRERMRLMFVKQRRCW